MEKKYKLKVTPAASYDLDEIYTYIAENLLAIEAAENLMSNIEQSIKRLREFPYQCELSKDEVLKQKEYRKLVVKNYIVIYKVDEEEKIVIIARVFYGAMDYSKYI